MRSARPQVRCAALLVGIVLALFAPLHAQGTAPAKIKLGSETAKNGFKNEDEIRDKFNDWRNDHDAREWLIAMNFDPSKIESVVAAKPHGEKADVEITVTTADGVRKEGISIKLVSSANGFNQVDKRWLATYARMWKMPDDVHNSLKFFVGEVPPAAKSRDPKRMYLNELSDDERQAVLDFFTANKDKIAADLIAGSGVHAARWVMVAYKATDDTRWVIRSASDAIKYFSEGDVELTRTGNLKIGRITMQRKGGDGGRETAKMLQFKINPVQLFPAQ